MSRYRISTQCRLQRLTIKLSYKSRVIRTLHRCHIQKTHYMRTTQQISQHFHLTVHLHVLHRFQNLNHNRFGTALKKTFEHIRILTVTYLLANTVTLLSRKNQIQALIIAKWCRKLWQSSRIGPRLHCNMIRHLI